MRAILIGKGGKFGGKFSLGTVKKAALICGIIFSLIVTCSVFMKINNIPGYGLLRIVGTGLFCLFAIPLQLIYNLKRNANGLRIAADVVGTFGMWFLLTGLLFKAQSWPGAELIVLVGSIVFFLFVSLFIAASRKTDVKTQWFTGFTATAFVIIGTLGISGPISSTHDDEIKGFMIIYNNSKDELETEKDRAHELINAIDTSRALDSNERNLAMEFYSAAMDASDDIERIKKQLVLESNLEYGVADEDKAILNPGDTDFTTYFMVGEDLTKPDGKGMLVYENLQQYNNHVLPKSVKFGMPTPAGSAKDQWVKDNFYHATVIEALTRLTQAQIVIQKSIVETLETKAYIE